MASLTKLILLSALAAVSLALPRPDEYKIPDVGRGGSRSQYYVLHDDGSFKYGYDTGDDAFESQKTDSDGEVDGKFGYRDPDGQSVNIQYTSGAGGFVARGAHIPQVHPDVAATFAARRAQGPFVDPLADADGDRSFNFDFDGDEYSRNEESDSDGTVTGSYSYVDEFGRTRTYRYRAGKGIGFVIEGDDLPQPVQPLPTHTTTTQVGGAHRAQTHSAHRAQSHRALTHSAHTHGAQSHRAQSHRAASHASSQSSAAGTRRQSSTRKLSKPSTTYFPPSNTASSSSFKTRASSGSASSHQSSFSARTPTAGTRTAAGTTFGTRNFEASNARTSFSPSGSYSLAYETSSHSRQESGDDDNDVEGQFSFRADDDGETRSVNYVAGSRTGFVAQGRHLPIGPVVPGAPTGQVTGNIVPVQEIPFVDPLADDDTDASYNFGFDSDSYSRSEVADEDGNVSGTYSILGEDGVLRTYRFRAGEGVGFETEEISAVQGQRRAQTSASSSTRQSSFSHGSVRQAAAVAPTVTSYAAPQVSAHSSRASAQSAFSSGSRGSGSGARFSSGSSGASSASSSSSSNFGTRRTSFSQSQRSQPNFTLRQYDQSEGRGKYGYVLKFDD